MCLDLNHSNIAYLQKTTLPYENNVLDLDPTVKGALGFPVIRITADNKDNEKKLGAFMRAAALASLRRRSQAESSFV